MVVDRKLGREGAAGQFLEGDDNTPPLIEVDPRLSPRQRLEVVIHEFFHEMFPEKSETWVRTRSKKMCRTLWNDGYRRIYHEPHEKKLLVV